MANLSYSAITSYFGPRRRFRTKNGRLSSGNHGGIDIRAPKGTPVPAMEDGVVERIVRNPDEGYGNYVVLRHPDNSKTLYAHLSSFGNIHVGMEVKKGTRLGGVGQTGNSTGDHLHFTLFNANGKKINPLNKYSLADFNYFALHQPSEPLTPKLESLPTETPTPARLAKSTAPRPIQSTSPQLAKATPSRPVKSTSTQLAKATPPRPVKSLEPTQPAPLQQPYQQLVYTPPLAPNWWQRNMPVIFGGWSKDEWTAYHRQQELDREIFTGITARQLMAKGFTDQQIDAMQDLVQNKYQQSLTGNLSQKGIRITTSELQKIGLDKEDAFALARMSSDSHNRMA